MSDTRFVQEELSKAVAPDTVFDEGLVQTVIATEQASAISRLRETHPTIPEGLSKAAIHVQVHQDLQKLDNISAMKTSLRARLAAIRDRQEAINRCVAVNLQLTSAFQRVPDEIWEEVFTIACHTQPWSEYQQSPTGTNPTGYPSLGGEYMGAKLHGHLPFWANDPACALWIIEVVCSRWRRVVERCARLYTFIAVECDKRPLRTRTTSSEDARAAWYKRKKLAFKCLYLSQQRPLSLLFLMEPNACLSVTLDRRYLKHFFAVSNRWKRVQFPIVFLNITSILDFETSYLPCRLSNLEELQFHGPISYIATDRRSWKHFPRVPVVTRIHFQDLSWARTPWSASPVCWRQITHYTSIRCRYPRGALEALLRLTTNLQSFTSIDDHIPVESWVWRRPARLFHLRSLTLYNGNDTFLRCTLSQLLCPGLSCLDIQQTNRDRDLHAIPPPVHIVDTPPFLRLPYDHLTKLTCIFNTPVKEGCIFTELVMMTRNLEELTLLAPRNTTLSLSPSTVAYLTQLLLFLPTLRVVRIPDLTFEEASWVAFLEEKGRPFTPTTSLITQIFGQRWVGSPGTRDAFVEAARELGIKLEVKWWII